MNDLQKCQFELLKEFIRLCEKHNLRYFLVGGTCLGAIRHEGFIPWDDDIDVAMPRPDYEKFVKLQNEIKEGYFIQTYKTDKKYSYNFGKIRDNNTTYIENFYYRSKINHGVWIDIFVLDGASKTVKHPAKLKNKIRRIWFHMQLCYPYVITRNIRLKTFPIDLVVNLFSALGYLLNIGKWMNKYNDKILTKIPYDEAAMVGNLCSFYTKKECVKREVYGNGVKKMFEGLECVVPEQYDVYLSQVYGDYMKLPPENKRIGHHHDKGFSLTQGYKDYIKEHKL